MTTAGFPHSDTPGSKLWLTAPRGLSWPPTSFIGSWCQGIHRAPLKTWPQMLASTVQFSNNDQPPITPTTHGEFTGAGTEGRPYGRTLRTQQRARHPHRSSSLSTPRRAVLADRHDRPCRIINVPPMSNQHRTFADVLASDQPKPVSSAP